MQTSNARRAWETIGAERQGLWCLDCRDEGQTDWLYHTCRHILESKPELEISPEVVRATIRQLAQEPARQPDWQEVNRRLEEVKQDITRARTMLANSQQPGPTTPPSDAAQS